MCQCDEPSIFPGSLWWGYVSFTIEGDRGGILRRIVSGEEITHKEEDPIFVIAACKCAAESAMLRVFDGRNPDRAKSVSATLIDSGGEQNGPFQVQIAEFSKAS